MFIIVLFFMFVGMFIFLFYMLVYVVFCGMLLILVGYLFVVFNMVLIFGWIIFGILVDKYGWLNVFVVGGISSGIVIFCMNLVVMNVYLIGYVIVFGFVLGIIIFGVLVVFFLCFKDLCDMGIYMGMGMVVVVLGGFVGFFVNGVFVSYYYGFFEVLMFSGLMCFLGGIVVFLMKFMKFEGFFGRIWGFIKYWIKLSLILILKFSLIIRM